MHTKKIIISFLIVLNLNSYAQDQWSLDRCVNYALENNIQIKQQELNARYQKNVLRQSQFNRLPNINANASGSQTFGSSVDPFTSDFTEYDTRSANFNISASMTLFNGFQNENTIRQSHFDFKASLQDAEKMKNDISLNIAAAYLQILFSEELLEVAKIQAQITEQQVERTKVLVDAGSLPKGNLLEVKSQLANEQLQVVNAENQLKTSYLTLIQILDLDTINNFEIIRPEIGEPDALTKLPPLEQIYSEASELPQIKSAEYRLYSSQKSLAIAKGSRSPSLTLSASVGTGYSSARSLYEQSMGDPVPIGYVEGTNQPVMAPTMNTSTLDYPFNQQLNDNVSTYLTLNLRIPIFNNYRIQSTVSNSKINVENYRYQLKAEQNLLYKEIQQAHNDVYSAMSRYNATKHAVEAMEESFEYTQQKFDLGLLTSIDYNTAKNNLTKAKSDLLQAKYDYVFKLNIINFYRGKPLQIK